MMKQRLYLVMLFLGMFVVTAGESHAQVRIYNGYGRGAPGVQRYYGYGNGRYDNGYGPRRLNSYGYSNYGNGPYGNGPYGSGYLGNRYGNAFGNRYGNGYRGYPNEYNYQNGYNNRNGFVFGVPFGFGISTF